MSSSSSHEPIANLASFVETTIRSGLITRGRLDEVLNQLPGRDQSADLLAEKLIGSGELTRFQVDKLRQGLWQGLLVEPYRLLFPIGRGGMGIVYLACDQRIRPGRSTPRLVALKLLPPKKAQAEPRTLVRFQREMEIGRKLPRHPHLARTLDSGEQGGVHYLAMEYVQGKTAKQLLVDGGPLAIPLAARVFADVALGLQALHTSGFVHRDLKPSNVVVTPLGRGKLLDFGFIVRRGEKAPLDPAILGGVGYTLGTMDYLPPEQAANATAVGAETDIYSLGCSLYHVLAGRPPFPDGSAREKIRAHRSREPEPLDKLNPAVPRDFARLVQWMMAKRPEDRPQSAAQVAYELERWASEARESPAIDRYDTAWEQLILGEVEARWRQYKNQTQESTTLDELIILDEPIGADASEQPGAGSPAKPKNWLWLAAAAAIFVFGGCCAASAGGLAVWLAMKR